MTAADWERIFGDASAVVVALWIAAAIALIMLVVRAWPTIRRFVRTIDALAGLPEFMQTTTKSAETQEATMAAQKVTLDGLANSLGQVRHEVLPNNGGSLRDAVDKTNARIDTIDLRQQKADARLDNDHLRIAELDAAIREKDTES